MTQTKTMSLSRDEVVDMAVGYELRNDELYQNGKVNSNFRYTSDRAPYDIQKEFMNMCSEITIDYVHDEDLSTVETGRIDDYYYVLAGEVMTRLGYDSVKYDWEDEEQV